MRHTAPANAKLRLCSCPPRSASPLLAASRPSVELLADLGLRAGDTLVLRQEVRQEEGGPQVVLVASAGDEAEDGEEESGEAGGSKLEEAGEDEGGEGAAGGGGQAGARLAAKPARQLKFGTDKGNVTYRWLNEERTGACWECSGVRHGVAVRHPRTCSAAEMEKIVTRTMLAGSIGWSWTGEASWAAKRGSSASHPHTLMLVCITLLAGVRDVLLGGHSAREVVLRSAESGTEWRRSVRRFFHCPGDRQAHELPRCKPQPLPD